MRIRLLLPALLMAACSGFAADEPGWTKIFDGKTLDGWKANQNAESWSVKDGAIVGDGDVSHLFYMGAECENCEFKAEVKINHGGNSGMYVRAKFGPAFRPATKLRSTARTPIGNAPAAYTIS